MSKSFQWLLGAAVVVVALAIGASLILPFFFPGTGTYGGYGMMGPGMMRGWGGWGMSGFGLGMMAWPLLLVVLVGVGIYWSTRGQNQTPAAPARTCSSCGRPLQADWKACPYCGERLQA